jgi:hypothetical protein
MASACRHRAKPRPGSDGLCFCALVTSDVAVSSGGWIVGWSVIGAWRMSTRDA